MLYKGKNLNLAEYVAAKETEYNGYDGSWEESECFIWAIQEYFSSCPYDGESILWLREHNLSIGDFNDNLSVEEIAEVFIDDHILCDTEIDYIIKWLYEYMTANDMSLSELYYMCDENTGDVFNMIF